MDLDHRTPRPYLTAQDIAEHPTRYLAAGHPDYDPDAARRANATLCEHGMRLVSTCPCCDGIDADLDRLPVLRTAYYQIVSWGTSHAVPGGIAEDRIRALHLLGLVDLRPCGRCGQVIAAPRARNPFAHAAQS